MIVTSAPCCNVRLQNAHRGAERVPIMQSNAQEPQNRCGALHPKGHDMTFHSRFRTAAAVAAVAVATTFGTGMALAQPHGPHGHPGAGGVEIGQLIAHAKDKLNLNTSQQGMFDKAVADSKAARDAGRALHDKVKATLTTELAKAEPDLVAVAAAADAAADQ